MESKLSLCIYYIWMFLYLSHFVSGQPESNSFKIFSSFLSISLFIARVCLETRDKSKHLERQGKDQTWTLGSTGTTKVVFKKLTFDFQFISDRMNEDKYTSDVLVLGAGMAGIAAAKTLTELGVTNIMVVEGSNRFIVVSNVDLGLFLTI